MTSQSVSFVPADQKHQMDKKLILILCEPRTGSNLLVEALNLYSELQPINEFYLSPNVNLYIRPDHIPEDLPHKVLLTEEQRHHLENYLNVDSGDYFNLIKKIYEDPINSLLELYKVSTKTLVVKIHHEQYEEAKLQGLLDLSFVKVILLERSSKLHAFVSHQKARQFDTWYGTDTSNIKVTVDIDKFLAKQKWSFDWYAKLRDTISDDMLEVNYERDLAQFDQTSFCTAIESWLTKIGIATTRSNYKMHFFKKQNLAPLKNSIENYAEVVNALQQSNVKYT